MNRDSQVARIGAALLLAVSLGAGAAYAQEAEPDVVIMTGRASVQAAPDRAFVSVTAEARALRPREAQQESAEAMDRTLRVIREQGIPDEAIRTVVYDLEPRYDYVDGRQVFREFVARNIVEVRMDQLDALGGLIDRIVEAGATAVTGVRFDVKDRTALEREALTAAVADARARAEAAAAGAGRGIDRVIRIQDQVSVPGPEPRFARTAVIMQAEAVETPVAPGQIEITAVVTLTAALK